MQKKAKYMASGSQNGESDAGRKYGGFCVSIEKMVSGFDLSYPLISRPEESQRSKNVSLETKHIARP